MFFIKSFLQLYLHSNVCDMTSLFRNKWEQKHRVPDTYYVNKDCEDVIKFMKVTSNLTQCKKRRNTKTRLPKETVENADLYKPALNKIMTTHEYCVKYNFVAPLKQIILK